MMKVRINLKLLEYLDIKVCKEVLLKNREKLINIFSFDFEIFKQSII